MERVIPLSRRKGDIVVLVYFWINILFITYIVDLEQNVLPDISGDWEYPLWPPAFFVDIIHWYGRNFDPVLIARPVWWRMTIWIDSLFDNARKLLITDSEGFELYESNYEFPGEVSLSSMLRDGIDYIIDMEEEVAF